MIVNRKNKGTASVLQVTLLRGEVWGNDPSLEATLCQRLHAIRLPNDSKFIIMCDGVREVGTFTNDRNKLKSEIQNALRELRQYMTPEATAVSDAFVKALLPPGMAEKLSMG